MRVLPHSLLLLPLLAGLAGVPLPSLAQAAEPEAEAAQADETEAGSETDRRIEVLAAEIERLRLGEVAPAATISQYGLGPAASKVYQQEKGVSLGGYGEMLYQNGLGGDADARIDFYRAILYAGYKFNEHFVLNTELEFEHITEVALEFAYLDFLWRPELNLRAGLLLVPMGLTNELHEPTVFLGALRPETERRLLPTTWRENGVGVFGEVGPLRYRAYLLNGFDAEGFSSSGLRGGRQKGAKARADDFAGVARVDYVGTEGLLVGGSVYYGGADQGRWDHPVNTLLYEAHADFDWRGLQLRGLFARGQVDGAGDLNATLALEADAGVAETLQGWYLQAGYDVLSLVDVGDLSLTPYVRYEQLDTQRTLPDGFVADPAQDQALLTLGAAFQPIPQIIVKADYQRVTDGADGEEDALNVLLGYIF